MTSFVGQWVTYDMELVLRGRSVLAGCQPKILGTYVDCSITDRNAHRNNLDGQNSKVIQNRVTM